MGLFGRRSSAGKLLEKIYAGGLKFTPRMQDDALRTLANMYDGEKRDEVRDAILGFNRKGKTRFGKDPICDQLIEILYRRKVDPGIDFLLDLVRKTEEDSPRRWTLWHVFRYAPRDHVQRMVPELVSRAPEMKFPMIGAWCDEVSEKEESEMRSLVSDLGPLLGNGEWRGSVVELANDLHARVGGTYLLDAALDDMITLLEKGATEIIPSIDRCNTEQGREAIVAGLESTHEAVRFGCARIVAGWGDERALPVLEELVQIMWYRRDASNLLRKLDREDLLPDFGEYPDVANHAFDELFRTDWPQYGEAPKELTFLRRKEIERAPMFQDGAEAYLFSYHNNITDNGFAFYIWKLDGDVIKRRHSSAIPHQTPDGKSAMFAPKWEDPGPDYEEVFDYFIGKIPGPVGGEAVPGRPTPAPMPGGSDSALPPHL